MDSLYWSNDLSVIADTFIIRIEGNPISEKLASRCAKSCDDVNQSYRFWDAYDGTGTKIIIPDHHNDTMKMLKLTDPYLTRGEVACALSHISLWVQCILIDKPIVILEHDAIMINKYVSHGLYNSICYLGGIEQAKGGWDVTPIPPHGSDGRNFRFLCRAHAYSIDPVIAKNMVAHVLQMGIHTSADRLLRADIFPIHQMGIYAFDLPEETTIPNRTKTGDRNSIKNDYLEI